MSALDTFSLKGKVAPVTRGMGKDGDGYGLEWTWIVIKKHPQEENTECSTATL